MPLAISSQLVQLSFAKLPLDAQADLGQVEQPSRRGRPLRREVHHHFYAGGSVQLARPRSRITDAAIHMLRLRFEFAICLMTKCPGCLLVLERKTLKAKNEVMARPS